VTCRTFFVICVFPARLWMKVVFEVPLCGHRSYVAFRQILRFCRDPALMKAT
jgi:hypothetical protein